MAGARLRVLLLCDDRRSHAGTVLEHIGAFVHFSRHEVVKFNPVGLSNSVALDMDAFDVVVIHYSLILSNDAYVSPAFREKLRRFSGLKVQFIQDEYRWVDRATDAMREAGVGVLFTCAPEPAAGQLYDQRLPGVRRILTLTGYVPDALRRHPRSPLDPRPFDVVYRGRDLPYWLGRLTQEKTWIAEGFLGRSATYGLKTDIAWREQDRVYGERWIDFMSSGRATLGTESGASIADFDGGAESAVKEYLAGHPHAPFEEVREAVLVRYEGNVVVNVISPRVFEAAALGTALVMFPGTYSGIAVAGEHYIPLAKDFSNMDEVVDRLRDLAFLTRLTERAHADLVASGRWSYETFIAGFDQVVSEQVSPRRERSRRSQHRLANVERAFRLSRPTTGAFRLVRRLLSKGKRLIARNARPANPDAVV